MRNGSKGSIAPVLAGIALYAASVYALIFLCNELIHYLIANVLATLLLILCTLRWNRSADDCTTAPPPTENSSARRGRYGALLRQHVGGLRACLGSRAGCAAQRISLLLCPSRGLEPSELRRESL